MVRIITFLQDAGAPHGKQQVILVAKWDRYVIYTCTTAVYGQHITIKPTKLKQKFTNPNYIICRSEVMKEIPSVQYGVQQKTTLS